MGLRLRISTTDTHKIQHSVSSNWNASLRVQNTVRPPSSSESSREEVKFSFKWRFSRSSQTLDEVEYTLVWLAIFRKSSIKSVRALSCSRAWHGINPREMKQSMLSNFTETHTLTNIWKHRFAVTQSATTQNLCLYTIKDFGSMLCYLEIRRVCSRTPPKAVTRQSFRYWFLIFSFTSCHWGHVAFSNK